MHLSLQLTPLTITTRGNNSVAFDQGTRNRLQKFVSESRAILTEEFTRQLQANYGLDPQNGSVSLVESLAFLDNRGQQTAIILRENLAHYVTSIPGKSDKERTKQAIDRIIREQAFTVLNRLCALRMAEARDFLFESISKGYSSKGFKLYKSLAGTALGETGDSYRCYLFSLFDEFSFDLAALFDRYSLQGQLFPRESALLALLEKINHYEIEHLWAEDETIGWIYQFWNGRDEIDCMRAASRAPRNSREMAVRNQFFTPRYVVEFLTDNTLGQIWYDMTKGKTALADSCRYLVRKPTEIFLSKGEMPPEEYTESYEDFSQEELIRKPVYIPFRHPKDPRELRMLDPACGSMHFGLYAFDLFEKIYEEAWYLETEMGLDALMRSGELKPLQTTYSNFEEFKISIPKLIIEYNIHGVDIDPRAVQIAGLSLWQRAQRSWHQMGIKPNQRPTIRKSNIVCAEPMPCEMEMLNEFASKLNPSVLGQLVETIFDKMKLAGEAGTLLKIEEEIKTSISKSRDIFNKELEIQKQDEYFLPGCAPKREYKLVTETHLLTSDFWNTAEDKILDALNIYSEQAEFVNGQKRLFADDAAKGFAFIDLCQKRFDVVLMNPPFGEASLNSKAYIERNYIRTKGDLLANFIERAIQMTDESGIVGAITSRTSLFLSTMAGLREQVFGIDAEIEFCADLGDGVLDAMVETAAYTISKGKKYAQYFRLVNREDKQTTLIQMCQTPQMSTERFIVNPKTFRELIGTPYCYWVDTNVLHKISLPPIDPSVADVKVGLQTGDDFRFLRNFWEVPVDSEKWQYFSKTEEAIPWYSPIQMKVWWVNDGYELKNFTDRNGNQRSALRSPQQYFKPGFSYMLRSSRLVPYIVPRGCIPTAGRSQVFPHKGNEIEVLAICASNIGSAVARFRGEMFARPKFQAGMVQQLPYIHLTDEVKQGVMEHMMKAIEEARAYYAYDETTLDYIGAKNIEIISEPKTDFSSLIGNDMELLIASCYGLNEKEYDELQLDLQQAVSLRKGKNDILEEDLQKLASFRYLSFLIGCAFGRWSIKSISKQNINDIYSELPKQPLAFKNSTSNDYIELNGITDLVSERSVIRYIDTLETNKIKETEKALSLVGGNDWFTFLSKPTNFFDFHLNQYSQNRRPAPIYWPLQTQSGSYTIWIYYHHLTEQTLYTCVNDFVEPKMKAISDDLNELRYKSARSRAEDTELAKLTDIETELKDFCDELLRIAKFWKPNLNDGVQITAAPLWKLFQHKQWKKKLKETWENMEKGDYDWAHMAYTIWPERVLRKCHEDHSLAIAHHVEEVLWTKVEVKVDRNGNSSEGSKTEWKPRSLTENQWRDLISQKIAEEK